MEETIETNAVFEALENNSMILDDNVETKRISNEIEYIDDIGELSLKEMLKEMVESEDGVWKCKVCGKISLAHAKEHGEIHSKGLRYPCVECGKSFKNSSTIRQHKRIAHGVSNTSKIDEQTKTDLQI